MQHIKPIIQACMPVGTIEQLSIASVTDVEFRTKAPVKGVGDYLVAEVSLGEVMEQIALTDPVGCVCDLSVLDRAEADCPTRSYDWQQDNPMNTMTTAEIFKAAYQVALRKINMQLTDILIDQEYV